MVDVTAIILAAGMSRRMGTQNKLLLRVGGVPMIRHMVEVYSAAAIKRILVVTGHQADEVETVLAGSPAETVFNVGYKEGQSTSVACGLRAAIDAQHILVGLGDQPLLSPADIQSLMSVHLAADRTRISIPLVNQQRGNPIVVPGVLRERLLEDPRSPGCKTFTRNHPEHVQFHEFTSPGYCEDVDTPDAYAALVAGSLRRTT